MKRRAFVAGLGAVLAAPLAAEAQQAGKCGRSLRLNRAELNRRALSGQISGTLCVSVDGSKAKRSSSTVALLRRTTSGFPLSRRSSYAFTPDLLMASGGPATSALKRATAPIPIVMWNTTDPIGIGLMKSIARPGGNVTGRSDDQGPQIMGKRLQMLKELVPALSKLALLDRVPPSTAIPRLIKYERAREKMIKERGLQEQRWRLQGPNDIDNAFTALTQGGFGAIQVAYVAVTWAHRRQIQDRAARYRLPAIYWHRKYVLEGGLLSYGEDDREVPRKMAVYVDRILRGARPGDLPVEQPAKFELVINLKTAKALGLTIPPSLLAQAGSSSNRDRIIDRRRSAPRTPPSDRRALTTVRR